MVVRVDEARNDQTIPRIQRFDRGIDRRREGLARRHQFSNLVVNDEDVERYRLLVGRVGIQHQPAPDDKVFPRCAHTDNIPLLLLTWASPAMARPMAARDASARVVRRAMRPADMTAIVSASSRISSRSSLMSKTAAPALRTAMIFSRMRAAAAKSRPKQGLAAISRPTSRSPSSRASRRR